MGWLGGLVGLPLAFRGVGKWDAALGAAAEAATLSEKVADRSTASWLGTHMGSRPSGMQWILRSLYYSFHPAFDLHDWRNIAWNRWFGLKCQFLQHFPTLMYLYLPNRDWAMMFIRNRKLSTAKNLVFTSKYWRKGVSRSCRNPPFYKDVYDKTNCIYH